ncbi:MAG: hypothetical protein P3X23_009110, partial [Thermosynechococcus sp. Uc]
MKYRLPYVAVTGRVKTFLDGAPTLPVSCTTYVVKDYQGYLDSLKFTSYALRHGAGVSLHIGELDLSDFPTASPNVYFYLSKDHLDYEEFSQLPNVVSEPVGQVIQVYDSMMESIPGTVSIEDAWLLTHTFKSRDSYTIDLSLLRPKGKANGRGLVASGPCSFALIFSNILNVLAAPNKVIPIMRLYSRLNEVLRRGGIYKNGAIVIHCDIDSPLCLDFLSATRADCPWARMSLNLDKDCNPKDTLQKAIPLVRSGDLFLVKKVYDANGRRIYHNVCLEVLLPHRGTCLLTHVNLGSTPKSKIAKAFERGMKFLCLLHSRTGVDKDGVYLSPSQDRQVGLGVIGLANLLAFYQVKYKDFVHALKLALDGVK